MQPGLKKYPELSSQRYLLTQIVKEDQQFIFEGLSHPQVIAYYGVSFNSYESTSEQMEFYDRLLVEGTGMWWKIIEKSSSRRVGAIGFNNYQLKHRKAEIGYWLLPAYWGNGVISEVLGVVINYLQQDLNMHRIEALIEKDNERSCKTLEKAGFINEGLLRDYELKNGKFISLHMYALLV